MNSEHDDFSLHSNDIFQDERLNAQEMGLIAFMRYMKWDADFCGNALRRRFGLGVAEFNFIMKKLADLGYVEFWVVPSTGKIFKGGFTVKNVVKPIVAAVLP